MGLVKGFDQFFSSGSDRLLGIAWEYAAPERQAWWAASPPGHGGGGWPFPLDCGQPHIPGYVITGSARGGCASQQPAHPQAPAAPLVGSQEGQGESAGGGESAHCCARQAWLSP